MLRSVATRGSAPAWRCASEAVAADPARVTYVQVALNLPLRREFTYSLPAGASAGLVDALQQFRRQALHARRLAFEHPVSAERLTFTSPLAPDLAALVAVLRSEDPLTDTPP